MCRFHITRELQVGCRHSTEYSDFFVVLDEDAGKAPAADTEDTEDTEDENDYDDLMDDIYRDEYVSDDDDEGDDYSDTDDDDKPLIRCKRPECLIYCEHGERADSRGCPTCDCLPAPVVASSSDKVETVKPKPDCSRRPMCAMFCTNGFMTGSDGCPVCQCNPSGGGTGSTGGLIGRPDGHELKPNQPDSCKNKPICRMFCQLGFQTGDDGCDVCACLEDPCLVCATCCFFLSYS